MPIIVNNTLNLIRSMAMGGDDRASESKPPRGIGANARQLPLGGRLRRRPRASFDHRVERPQRAGDFPFPGDQRPDRRSHSGEESRNRRRRAHTIRATSTAFGSTLSEIIVPVLSPDGRVLGTVDVESQNTQCVHRSRPRNDRAMCIQAALPLWLLR